MQKSAAAAAAILSAMMLFACGGGKTQQTSGTNQPSTPTEQPGTPSNDACAGGTCAAQDPSSPVGVVGTAGTPETVTAIANRPVGATTDPAGTTTGGTAGGGATTGGTSTGGTTTGGTTTGGTTTGGTATGGTTTGGTTTGGTTTGGTTTGGTTTGGTTTPTYLHEWYVSNSGSDSNPGTSAAPFKTINKGISAANPGDRITVRAGSYREDVNIDDAAGRDGTAAQPITLQGEGMPKILPAGHYTMVLVGRPHWILDGFEIDIEGQNKDGIGFYRDANGSTLRNSVVHNGTGAEGVNVWDHAQNVVIENNQIHDIFKQPIDDAHGVHVEWTTTNTVVRNNTIYGNSGDDVQCEGPEPYGDYVPADGVTIENNDLGGSYEQAFDIKTCNHVTIRNNHIHDFPTGGGATGVIHMSASNVLVENNLFENLGKAITLGGNRVGPMPANVVIRGNRMRGIFSGPGTDGINREGVGIWIENADHPLVENNTILGAQVAALHIGGGENGNTDGLMLRNNILDGKPLIIGPYAPGLQSVTNLFLSGSQVNGQSVSSWMSSIGDTGSKLASAPLANPDTFAPASIAVDAATPTGRASCGAGLDIGAVETGCTP